jgi:hypothetical protein
MASIANNEAHKAQEVFPGLQSDVDDVHRRLARAADAARSAEKSAIAADCLTSVISSAPSLRHDIRTQYELKKVKCHAHGRADRMLLGTHDISHLDPALSDLTLIRDKVRNLSSQS